MTALSSHPAQVLEELNLGYNSIGDKSIEYIAEYIKVNIFINIMHLSKPCPTSPLPGMEGD